MKRFKGINNMTQEQIDAMLDMQEIKDKIVAKMQEESCNTPEK